MNRIAQCFEIEELENAELTTTETASVDYSMYTIEAQARQALAARFVVNKGGQWDETNSRMHCCEVFYRDTNYIQQSIIKWACSIKEAYEMACDAWLKEKSAGRAS